MMNSKHYEFDSIGTHWWCEILDDSATFNDALVGQIQQTCEEFDQRYSRFRDDSLVSTLARTGRLVDPPGEFLRMLDFAKEIEWATNGAFTIGVGPVLHMLGYGAQKHGGHTPTNLWSQIHYDTHEITIPQGLMLDFGGQGKGWLIDNLTLIMQSHGATQFIINGGGDIYIQSDSPIDFALEDPYDSTRKIGQTTISRGALAGSSTLKRSWHHNDSQQHHLIDPATDQPSATGIVASYVKADSALMADVMATVLIVRPDLEFELARKYSLQVILIPSAS